MCCFAWRTKVTHLLGHWLSPAPSLTLKIKSMPNASTLWRAWRRIPPRFYLKLAQLCGRGARDKCIALNPTHFQITRSSVAYCNRIKRKLEQEPNRKTTIETGTGSLRIVDDILFKYHRRNGLDDLDKILGEWVDGNLQLFNATINSPFPSSHQQAV